MAAGRGVSQEVRDKYNRFPVCCAHGGHRV